MKGPLYFPIILGTLLIMIGCAPSEPKYCYIIKQLTTLPGQIPTVTYECAGNCYSPVDSVRQRCEKRPKDRAGVMILDCTCPYASCGFKISYTEGESDAAKEVCKGVKKSGERCKLQTIQKGTDGNTVTYWLWCE